MGDQLEPTWATRDLLILRYIAKELESGAESVGRNQVADALHLEGDTAERGMLALVDASPPYVKARIHRSATNTIIHFSVTAITERTRRELGTWPSPDDFVTQLAAALAGAAHAEPDPERKSRFRGATDTLTGIGHDLAVHYVEKKLGIW
jgi:hypothetical protein